MQNHLISMATAPGTTFAARLGGLVRLFLGKLATVPIPPDQRLQRDMGLLDEIAPPETPGSREADMQLLRSI